jgi:2,3-dimethylmalate lyase
VSELLAKRPNPRRWLRELLAESPPVIAPGVYDAMSARLVEEVGFPALYMSGFGVTASLLGRPDIGLLTMTDMVGAARRLVSAVAIPVIADADTGYGNAINVIRTVEEYEAAGVAAIHLEDQVTPKRCGHMAGKQVVPVEAMTDRIAAAAAARQDPDFVLIARSDAVAPEGVDAAIDRVLRYRDAGADMLYLDALPSFDDIGKVAAALAGEQVLFSWGEGGLTPPTSIDQLRRWGFSIVIFPVAALFASVTAIRDLLHRIATDGTPINAFDDLRLPHMDEFFNLVGCRDQRHRKALSPWLRT